MEQPLPKWSTGLFACCEDSQSCCFGFWCCACVACSVSKKAGEHRCLPMNDFCVYGLLTAVGMPLYVPPAALSLRVGIRKKYGIENSLCNDITVSCFCVWCSWCQMHRELKIREKSDAVVLVNMQPRPLREAPTAAPPPDGHVGTSSIILGSY
ncbi:cornifelin homolog B-like [Solea solea]|uniref:cornifelin homolog B-like n=1 Tax=Solea solea TaxID=90069 RepID=UPI00272A9D52|nr:cornifelin homolog B-like [Solea solea]